MNIYTGPNLINPAILAEFIEKNTDPYGKACVDVAINVMKYLDDFEGEFNIGYHPDRTTPHGIIVACDNQGGITGFMAGAARNIVAACHTRGWEFYLADVINSYSLDDPEEIERAVNNIINADCLQITTDQAEEYVAKLITRYKNKGDNDA